MTNNTPCLRNKTPTLLTLSATALALLLLASPLVLSNPLLLQPAQAQTTMTFKTPTNTPATGQGITLTFEAQGTASSSDPQSAKITNGTFQITDSSSGQTLLSGDFYRGGTFKNDTNGGTLFILGTLNKPNSGNFQLSTDCSTLSLNSISIQTDTDDYEFQGPVECSSSSSQGGGNTTTSDATMQPSSSSMSGTTTQDKESSNDGDGDRDGIPDSSDRCTHNSNQRCFKEDTTTQQQHPSSNRTGNQTRDR